LPAHQLHDLAADGQAQAGSFGLLAGLACLFKGLEDALQLLRSNAHARIFHPEAEMGS
jgi:hypothetical protein